MIQKKIFQSPVLGVFLCFIFSNSAVGFSVLPFQSPVLGVFLCFKTKQADRAYRKIVFQSPVLGVFLCFAVRKKGGQGKWDIEGIKEVYTTYGSWDIIAKIEAESIKDIEKAVIAIRKINGVEYTETLLCNPIE